MKFSVPELEADVKLDIEIKMYSRTVFLIYFFYPSCIKKNSIEYATLEFYMD